MRRVLLFVAALSAAPLAGCSTSGAIYPTPEAAVQALTSALEPIDHEKLTVVLGSRGADIIEPTRGAESESIERFLANYRAQHELVEVDDSTKILEVGEDGWPMPIPLVRAGSGWRFDTQAGIDEITARRIGRNELDIIQACLALVDAQREYAAAGYGGAPGLYAERIRSEPGKRDGLYWPDEPGVPESPLGEFAAQADASAIAGQGAARSFYGYRFKLLRSQGRHAPGGAMSYLDEQGRLAHGFAVVAFPAEYGESGRTTFIVNQLGVIYQQDLGSRTEQIVHRMKSYDPTTDWSIVEPWLD